MQMQTSNHNANISGSQPTIIQVAKNNTTTTLIQNGQHFLIGKIDQNSNTSVDNQTGNGTNNNMQGIYPLQCIEAAVVNANSNQANQDGNNTTVYGTTGQKIFYQDSNHASIYTSMSGQTATIIPASAIQHIKARDLSSQLGATVGSTVHIQTTPHAQIVHHGGNAYLVQSTTRLEDESPNMSHTTKASPVTVQWLCDNYETAEGVSLPRSTLYNHYLQHCQQEKLEPMNQASFGKLIRSVFFGLRTRRLGTRGNSKYHYYGIRIKPNSVLNHYVEDQTFAMRQYPSFHRQSQESDIHWRNRFSGGSNVNYVGSGGGGGGGDGSGVLSGMNSMNNTGLSLSSNVANAIITDCNSNTNQHSSYLGESSSALPNLSDIMTRAELDTLTEEQCMTEGITTDDIRVFCHMYLEHSDAVLSSVVYLNFKFIESLWQDFWRTSSSKNNAQLEDKLPKAQLLRLLRVSQVQSFLQLFDNMFYQSLVEVLIPNVLRPIPSALTQNIRHFAKSLEGWMSSATVGLHSEVVQIKMSCVCSLAQTLRRHTSLNHLAQAARAVLKNAGQISQMLTDLNRVDFSNVQEQASWVCGCDSKRVDALQHDFKRILQQQASLEEWAVWLDNVVNDVLEPYKNSAQYPHAAHQFIVKWSFYSSMVIRDLTLRSAASFGSFHLIRLLYDEYIYYLVEQKVADHLNLTPVAVTGEMGRHLMATEYGNYGDGHVRVEMDDAKVDTKSRFKLEHMAKKENDGLGGVVDADFRVGGCNSAAVDSNQSVSSSNQMADEQVDESADDDEGLDEEETEMQEQLTEPGRISVTTTTSGVPRLYAANVTMLAQKTESCAGRVVPILAGGNCARKTVNVTTFGDPQPISSEQGPVVSTVVTPSPIKVSLVLTSTSTTSTSIKSSPTTKTSSFTTDSTPSALVAAISTNKRIKLVSNCSLTTAVSGSTSSI